ncbi:MAG TPA: cytochrome c oxidase subunit I [Chloroflexota bacterium]|nr:cytochrome c oxidase subunit I [Chloroflexota bacterium]
MVATAAGLEGQHPAHAHGHSQSWVRAHILSTDHKVIGINYMITSFIFFLIAGLVAMVMRANLAQPHSTVVSPDLFNQLVTMHGSAMIFAFTIPMLMSGFGNYLMPLMIGAGDVAFPRLNLFSYLIFPPGALLMFCGFLTGGAAQAGWTSYVPLSTQTPIGQTHPLGQIFWLLSVMTLGVSSTATAINFLVTIFNMRAPGLGLMRLPLFIWALLVTVVLTLIATPALAGGLGVQLLQIVFGAPFFNPQEGGNALLWQHMFWFYSHPAVYIMILPAFGIISEVIPVFSRKPIFGYKAIAYSSMAIGLLAFLVWAHHMFTSGVQAWLEVYFMISTMVIAIPTGIKVFSWVATLFEGKVQLTAPLLFALGFVSTFTLGGITGIMLASVPVDLHEHGTYFLVAHLHYVLFGGSVFGVFTGLYMWWPKITGRMLDDRLGKLHFWFMYIFFNLTFFPMHIIGLLGMPRRVADYDPQFAGWNMFISICSFILGASFLIFIYNAAVSLARGERAPSNPWGARTLEWATNSPPGHGNFVRTPVVTWAPYDYTKPLPYFGPPTQEAPELQARQREAPKVHTTQHDEGI